MPINLISKMSAEQIMWVSKENQKCCLQKDALFLTKTNSIKQVMDSLKRRHSPMKNAILWLTLLFLLLPQDTNAYCWQPGKNPRFTDEPEVYQISLTKVRISWDSIVDHRDCADSFIVKYWKGTNPSKYTMTNQVEKTVSHMDIEVSPKIEYYFQAIAREDKGILAGIDYNRATPVKFKTSSFNKPMVPLPKPNPHKPGSSCEPNCDYNMDGNNEGAVGGMDELNNETGALGLTIEMLVIVIIVGLMFLLIIIGIMYKMCKSKKNSVDDDDDEDEESGGKESEDEDDDDEISKENDGLRKNTV